MLAIHRIFFCPAKDIIKINLDKNPQMKRPLFILLLLSSITMSPALDKDSRPIRPMPLEGHSVTTCITLNTTLPAETRTAFFTNILDTSLWPARWYCGVWTDFHGWLYISSDLMIWAAYFIIPLILGYFLYQRRKDVPFPKILFLFIGFILACGITHLVDAAIFWWPAYKLSAVIRFGTAIISWGTVFALIKVTPKLLDFKSPAVLEKAVEEKTKELKYLNEKLQQEIDEKNATQEKLRELNNNLEQKVALRTSSLEEVNGNLMHINSLFESVQEAAKIGVWEVNLENGSLYWSDVVYDIHELPRGTKVKLEEGINFYHDDYKSTIETAVGKGIEDGIGWDLKLKLITAKQNEVWVHAIGIPLVENGKTIKLRGLFQDIDLAVKSESKIKENEQNVTAIIENSKNIIWSIDVNYKLIVFNRAFSQAIQNVYGIQPEVGEYTLNSKFPDKLNKYWKSRYDKVFETGKQLVWEEVNKKTNEFSEISLNPIIGEGGEISGISGLSRDITQNKRQEEALVEVNNSLEEKVNKRTEELEQNNIKLLAVNKELESFSYSVSHDLRSPLRGIHGFTNALKEDYYNVFDDTGKDYLNRILAGTVRMGELIEDMLKLSRVSRAEVSNEEIDMSGLVKEVYENLDTGNSSIKIEGGVKATGDLPLIKTVLQNLLENSIKYSSKIANARIEFGVKQENGTPIYFINDNGSGFDMQYSQKLFSPFQRLHDRKEFSGNGIGLATVNRIILKHGGKIWAESKLNEGATFYFTLN